jgi:hypothetical protein
MQRSKDSLLASLGPAAGRAYPGIAGKVNGGAYQVSAPRRETIREGSGPDARLARPERHRATAKVDTQLTIKHEEASSVSAWSCQMKSPSMRTTYS